VKFVWVPMGGIGRGKGGSKEDVFEGREASCIEQYLWT
jgi:hypothetical protein